MTDAFWEDIHDEIETVDVDRRPPWNHGVEVMSEFPDGADIAVFGRPITPAEVERKVPWPKEGKP